MENINSSSVGASRASACTESGRKTAVATCPKCGLEYVLDMSNNKKGGFRCFGCQANLRYDPVKLSLEVA